MHIQNINNENCTQQKYIQYIFVLFYSVHPSIFCYIFIHCTEEQDFILAVGRTKKKLKKKMLHITIRFGVVTTTTYTTPHTKCEMHLIKENFANEQNVG